MASAYVVSLANQERGKMAQALPLYEDFFEYFAHIGGSVVVPMVDNAQTTKGLKQFMETLFFNKQFAPEFTDKIIRADLYQKTTTNYTYYPECVDPQVVSCFESFKTFAENFNKLLTYADNLISRTAVGSADINAYCSMLVGVYGVNNAQVQQFIADPKQANDVASRLMMICHYSVMSAVTTTGVAIDIQIAQKTMRQKIIGDFIRQMEEACPVGSRMFSLSATPIGQTTTISNSFDPAFDRFIGKQRVFKKYSFAYHTDADALVSSVSTIKSIITGGAALQQAGAECLKNGLQYNMNLFTVVGQAIVKTTYPAAKQYIQETPLFDITTRRVIKNENGKFVAYDAQGQKHEIDEPSIGDDCFGSHLTTDRAQCTSAIVSLSGMDSELSQFKRFVDNSPNVESADFSKMHPTLAVAILDKLGVKRIQRVRGGKYISEYENIDSWKSRIDTSNSIRAETKTTANTEAGRKMVMYLANLINFVNASPDILNATVGQPTTIMSNSLGLPVAYVRPVDDASGVHSGLLMLANNMKMTQALSHASGSLNPFARVVPGFPMMFGGSHPTPKLRELIEKLIKTLESKNKYLSEADRAKINAHLTNLERLEKNLEQIGEQLVMFKDWMNIVGDSNPETITVQSVQDSVHKYQECIRQHGTLERGIVNVATKLSECLSNK